MHHDEGQENHSVEKRPKHDPGTSLLGLMLQSQTWVHRRVDALRLDAEGTTRRHVSIDITAPSGFMISGSEDRFIIPIAILEKGTKRKLDATHAGKSISVLGRQDNGSLAVEMLTTSLIHLLPLQEEDVKEAKAVISKVVFSRPKAEAESALIEYLNWIAVRKDGAKSPKMLEVTNSMVQQLAHNFLFLVELDSDLLDTRTTVKYALNQEAPEVHKRGFKRVRFDYPVPDFGFAASQHLEVEVPEGLVVSRLELTETGPSESDSKSDIDANPNGHRLGHVALSPSQRFFTGRAFVDVVPTTQGLFFFTKLAVACIVLLFISAQLVRVFNGYILGPKAEIPSPSASILLIGPALLFSWMSRTQEHNLVVQILSPLRRVLGRCALALLGTAVLAAIPVTPLVWCLGWVIIGAFTISALWGLIRFAYGDRPSITYGAAPASQDHSVGPQP
ncbi:hypothetical protein [Paenarthrobacter sp. 4246]|uniref:hypothetical protein n=1 Tax=Paenarthrobacter sp. 4246 TaxID=3156456 RepID=UPI00339A6DAE